jgi:hypothetical protein
MKTNNVEKQKAQLKAIKERKEELRTLAGNLTLLNKVYRDILTPRQRALINFMFAEKGFGVFAHVPHKRFKLSWNNTTVNGYAFKITDEKSVGFFETTEKAEVERKKYVNDPTKNASFWLTADLVAKQKTYSGYSVSTVMMAIHWLENEWDKTFTLSDWYAKGKIVATVAQLETSLPQIVTVEETELEEVA